jgi:hypothetical protein
MLPNSQHANKIRDIFSLQFSAAPIGLSGTDVVANCWLGAVI